MSSRSALAVAVLSAALVVSSGGVQAQRAAGTDLYIVQVSPQRSAHGDVLRRAGVDPGRRVYDYSLALNGFAAALTERQAATLKAMPEVVRVWRNEVVTVDTVSTPHFLGVDDVWRDHFGGAANAGLGVIVGVIDTGIWPEHPSFAALPEPRPDRAVIAAKWHGTCEVIACNNKVIGARYYNQAGLALPHESLSPRDYHGHGSHTAGTAAGNARVEAVINGTAVGRASGMAPAARIAVYKALWDTGTGSASGAYVDLVKAIEDAVADGVDVINYSISGSRDEVVSPVDVAFFNAAEAGVFVATSAGNSGETIGSSSVAHNAPWTTTVAASTHDRASEKTLTLGDGRTFSGAGYGSGAGPARLVSSASVGRRGADPTQARLCFDGALDPSVVSGSIVVCERGTNPRVEKSLAVKNAGGVGMVLVNPTPQSVNSDFHSVPSIHLDDAAGAQVTSYAALAGATATISTARNVKVPAPRMATFSSYGPALAGHGDLLKPDLTAPGVDIIAAVAPPGNQGNLFASYQGTSMSAPHIAGIAALLISEHPQWSPMWVKSALMTSASPMDEADPLHYGNGHVRPAEAFDPGLVYDSTPAEWMRYVDGRIDPSDLNYPSIAIGDLVRRQTITRTVTNIDDRSSVYEVSVSVPAGLSVTVSPSRLVLTPGGSATFTVTITRVRAELDQWTFGSLTWRDLWGHRVRSALAVRPVAEPG